MKPWVAKYVELDRCKVILSNKWEEDNPHYVGAPYMSSLCREIANGQDVFLNTEIINVEMQNDKWQLTDRKHEKTGEYDWVVFAVTPNHMKNLMHFDFDDKFQLTSKKLSACFALMLGFNDILTINWQAALVSNSDISWISINSSKPDRNSKFCIIAQSKNSWADEHVNMDKGMVQSHLIDELSEILKVDMKNHDFAGIHRWRYANIEKQAGAECYMNTALRLAVVGDWFIGSRVESAFMSGYRAAKKMEAVL
ncbi:MAG: hypothetical protein HKN08_07515 [Gammaproteobacteria bacterium]|nr:hypothetical protein [Gammaproteobacteria bacterium]